MKNKTYLKASLREIIYSKGRFISIVLIILLGTLLYVGIKATGPILNHSASQFVDKQELSNLQIISTGGLTKEDEKLAETVPNAEVESGYQLFYADSDKNQVVKLYSYDKDNQQNQLIVKSGHLPKKDNEIVLDEKAKEEGYRLNQTYKIDQPDQLKRKNFKIVGFVQSPMYISTEERGLSNVGNGSVDFFAYLPENNFSSEIKSVIYLRFSNVDGKETYGKAYEKKMNQNIDKVEKLFAERPQERAAEIKAEAEKDLLPRKVEVTDNLAKVDAGQKELDQAKAQLEQQAVMVPTGNPELAKAQEELDAQQKELTRNREQLVDAQQKISDSEKEISELKTPSYSFNQRADNPGFQEYGDLSERIAAIANVFPIFFFFIAALITFTTMTRMVEENRREIGTLKALGYSRFEISIKYIIYALSAAAIGIVLGSVIGTHTLPRLIFVLSSDRYNFSGVTAFYLPRPIFQASIAFLFASLGAALLVLFRELHEKPADLLQPKAPKPGKRIFLERLTPIWSRMSFNSKVSYRNLFRYKSRMIMAVIGIAGCAALMVAGVGLKDSLSSVGDKQFGPIIDYDAIVTLKDQPDEAKVNMIFSQNKKLTSELAMMNQTVELKQKGQANQKLTMMVPKDQQKFKNYLHLKNQGEKFNLPNDGAVITQKMAELFNLEKGDSLTVHDEDQQTFKVKITNIADNYLGNFLYLSKDYYQQARGKDFKMNSYLLKSKKMTKSEEKELSQKLLSSGQVVNTSFISTQIEAQEQSMDNLDGIVWIFVVLSGLLAFIVLYNLTNINVSERVRELSTIKVLGFYDREVTSYIFRENFVFTILGILFGYGLGIILTKFILDQASMETITFPLVIRLGAYLSSGGLTILFSVIVMVATHFRLRHINMIDALKSNE
ncbi:FtsX-like permease family protein [Enterococcus avium]|uniref:ABC transporter permease n=1 Tax=Enterococcus avium TaxID=33945 RepID=UPI001C11B24B|nr:FtsX-like permease family protein [Enterococcus avium]MBU5368660.1 FtsX-like permease family protein [Enterococcus avium]MDO7799506.1 FtsX-like permease family protein [Enterococcus avium]MDT2422970.1 FtsX-like permease family protein [Enterococcus avium]MDT2470639.1 FtsX-like permease family protein [Enterococcus avium]MDT2492312.1 FtsX-like permease family protein [Enterococcus avium]